MTVFPHETGVSTVSVPYTIGGDLTSSLKAEGQHLVLTAAHLSQEDTSRNHDVWALYPVEGGYGVAAADALWRLSETSACEATRLIAFTHKTSQDLVPSPMALCAAVPFHEHARISTNLRTLSLIYAGLVAGEHYYAPIVDGVLVHFAATLAQGKAAGRAEPLRELVVALRARKELVDGSYFCSANWAAAVTEYALILCELYPWTATPPLFTPEDAFGYSLAQLESSLWTQISLTALKLAALDPRWLFIAEDAARSVISMRCSTCKSLATSYEGLAEVGTRRSPLSTTASKERTMARLLKNSNDDTWAHAQCIKEHTCWAYPSP